MASVRHTSSMAESESGGNTLKALIDWIVDWLIRRLEKWRFPTRAADRAAWLTEKVTTDKLIADIQAQVVAREAAITVVEAGVTEREKAIEDISNEDTKATIDRMSDDDLLRAPLRRSDG